MNGEKPKIEIFAPFGVAYEWMKTMLFRPFDAGRWFVIAFAAFLSGAVGGGFNPGGQLGRLGNGDWKYRSESHGNLPHWDATPWIIGIVAGIVLVALVLSVVWMWVVSRGKFIFTDCVVKNRAAIADPWREYRREGNSYFLFSLLIMAGTLLIIAIAALFLWLCFFGFHGRYDPGTPVIVIGIVVIGLIWMAFALFFGVVSAFMVPVMYRRRCRAKEAFLDVAKLVLGNPGPFVLFILFGIVLALGVAVIGTIVTCVTCCIGGLPYINTVLLLPAVVWLAAFKLLFFRQFGDPYDVWATAGVAASADASTQPPNEMLPPPAPPAMP